MGDHYQEEDSYLYDYAQDYPDSDMYYDEEEAYLQHLIQKEHERMASQFSLVNECLMPTFSQGVQSVWLLLVLCLAIRCLSLLKINAKLLHIASAITGVIAVWHFYEHLSGYVILLAVMGYLCMANKHSGSGAFLSAVCVAYMLSW